MKPSNLTLTLDLSRPANDPQPTFGDLRKFVELTKQYDDAKELPLDYDNNLDLIGIVALLDD